ncbi:MAG: DUF4231 domain-containing protein [Rhodanobacter sp.]
MSFMLPKTELFLGAVKEQTFFKDEAVQGSILWYIEYYKKRAPSRRLAFRTSGFLLLFLSISLPFFTEMSAEQHRAQIASVLAWVIALVAAANSFFNWQRGWQGYTQTQLSLQFALSQWELQTAEARAAPTDEEGLKVLQEALQKVVKTVMESVSSETAQYFEGVKVPDVQTKPSP